MTDSQRKFSCSLIYFQTSTKPWVSRCILSRSISRTRFLRVSVITHRAISDQVNLIICVIGATRTPHTDRQDAHRHDPPRSTKLIEPKWLWLGFERVRTNPINKGTNRQTNEQRKTNRNDSPAAITRPRKPIRHGYSPTEPPNHSTLWAKRKH